MASQCVWLTFVGTALPFTFTVGSSGFGHYAEEGGNGGNLSWRLEIADIGSLEVNSK
jgi:hypothetical protein